MTKSTGRGRPRAFRPIPALKAWMDERGLTQVELADIIGVGQAQVSRWLSGARALPVGIAVQLAHLTGIPAEQLSNRPETTRLLKLLGGRTNKLIKTLRNNAKVAEDTI